MTYLVTLTLNQNERTLASVRKIFSDVAGVTIDYDYGIVTISPKRNLYAIRVSSVDPDGLRSIETEISKVEGIIYEDSPISTCN
jgi:hypothetical protein